MLRIPLNLEREVESSDFRAQVRTSHNTLDKQVCQLLYQRLGIVSQIKVEIQACCRALASTRVAPTGWHGRDGLQQSWH